MSPLEARPRCAAGSAQALQLARTGGISDPMDTDPSPLAIKAQKTTDPSGLL